MTGMQIVVLAGGIGGARFLLGVRAAARELGADVTAIVNVGDDVTLHGLRICPDLDSVMYTLGGGADPERGWGRVGETWTVKEELAAYEVDPAWFGLGDRDVATHLVRTRMLNQGFPLSAVTEALCKRWQPEVARGWVKQGKHEALADIYESIDELNYYREHFIGRSVNRVEPA